MTRLERSRERRLRSQDGQIFILTVLILALGSGFLVFSLLGSRANAAEKNRATDAAFLQVKQALMGWSAARTPTVGSPTSRPGELPCPDMNNDGMDNDGACAAGDIGRVPWKTLDIPEPKDGNGETLWYAIAGPFRYKPQASSPITSDTLGTLTVYAGSSATTQTSQAIAVLFAPGPPIGTQARGSAAAACSTTGTTIAQNLCAANYLESTGGGNNAQINGPFIQAQSSSTFNDRVLAITNADLMPLVEQRVAREIMARLNQYKASEGSYPWADLANGDSNGDATSGFYNRPRFPCGTAKPTDWSALSPPIVLPDWLTNGCPDSGTGFVDGWSSVIYYAVAKNRLEAGGSNCTTCFGTTTLTVTNPNSLIADVCSTISAVWACRPTVLPASTTADLVLITPGSATASRIAGWSNSSFSAISGYFEDSENSDNNNDTYVVPSSTRYDRDRLYIAQ